jgi:hypothetical protein
VGEDFPEEAIRLLKEHNINLEGLETKMGKTFAGKEFITTGIKLRL